jgi:LysR family transcriptional regulator, regulator for bpeEF and oprC
VGRFCEKPFNRENIVWKPGTMDQLLSMRTFMRVADLSSFTKAADSLALSRAVTSTHIADLERYLGVRLLQRSTRRVSLTPDGHEYLERCRRIIAEIDAADDAMKGNRSRPQGKLRVDVPTAFGRHLLVPALPQFTSRYPEISLEIQYNERVVDMIAEEIDIAVRVGPIGPSNLIGRRVCRTWLLNCAAPGYLAKHGTPQDPEQLRNHKLVGLIRAATRRPRKWIFQKGRVRKQLTLPFAVAFSETGPALSAAIAGTGVVQMMDMVVADAVAIGRLDLILPDWSAEGPPISIVYPSTSRNLPKVRVFADFAADLLLQWRKHVDSVRSSAP